MHRCRTHLGPIRWRTPVTAVARSPPSTSAFRYPLAEGLSVSRPLEIAVTASFALQVTAAKPGIGLPCPVSLPASGPSSRSNDRSIWVGLPAYHSFCAGSPPLDERAPFDCEAFRTCMSPFNSFLFVLHHGSQWRWCKPNHPSNIVLKPAPTRSDFVFSSSTMPIVMSAINQTQ